MGGIYNEVVHGANVDFREVWPPVGQITGDGDLLIGNAIAPNIRKGNLISSDASINVNYVDPNIDLTLPTATPYYSLTPFIVGSDIHSQYATIGAALAAAPANSTIFIKAGSYVEDLIITKNVNLVGFASCSESFFMGTVTIFGQITISGDLIAVGINGISIANAGVNPGINLTSGSFILCENCVFSPSGNVGILINNASAVVILENCTCNSSATDGLFTITSGNLWMKNCAFTAGAGGAASTVDGGELQISNSLINFPIITSSTGTIHAKNVQFDKYYQTLSYETYITTSGTGSIYISDCTFDSANLSCVSIGAGTSVTMVHTDLNSSNTNVLTGAGTLNYAFISFSGSSSGHNVTTENALATLI